MTRLFLTALALTLCLAAPGCQPTPPPQPIDDPPAVAPPPPSKEVVESGAPRATAEEPPKLELGAILPPHARQALKLSAEQEKQLADTEKKTKKRLAKMLSDEQKKKFAALPPPSGPPEDPGPDGPPKPQLGGLLPPEARGQLRLTREQEKELDALEKEAKEILETVLTPEQQKKFASLPPPMPPEGAPKAPQYDVGAVLPVHARGKLKLTEEQEKEIEPLEAKSRKRLARILSEEQQKKLERLPPPKFNLTWIVSPPKYKLGAMMPPHAPEELKLNQEQKKDLAALEKDVRERLEKILTAEQKKMLENLKPPPESGKR